jgi:hypothetical protein
MSKFAYFEPSNGRILQWIDAAAMAYILPESSLLHPCSEEDWELRNQGCMMVKNGVVVPFVAPVVTPTQEQIIAQYETALDAHLDAVAQQYRYRDRVTFAMRAGYPGPWQSDGAKFGTWMDTCNAQAYALLESVLAGEVGLPSKEDFIASLPVFLL